RPPRPCLFPYTTLFRSLLSVQALLLVRRAHEGGGVEDQHHPAFAEDRGARHAGHLAVVRLQRLDDDLLLAEKRVDEKRHARAVRSEEHTSELQSREKLV